MTPIPFDKQGHRGCRGLMPENTISAMLKAIDLGVTTVEMDIVCTGDHQLILSHDPFFHHHITTKPDGSVVQKEEEQLLNIYRMSYGQVKNFDVGRKPHPHFPLQQKINAIKPLLTDVIESVEAYCLQKQVPLIRYNIEIKSQPETDNLYHPAPDVFVEELMKVIGSKKISERVAIQSFDFRPLRYLHQYYPTQKTGVLIEPYDKKTWEEHVNRLGFMPIYYNPHYSRASASVIAHCHQAGLKIIPWTVNTLEEIKELKDKGVDGIITDYPNLFDKLG